MFKVGIEFALLLLAFCRASVIYHLFSSINSLLRFSGIGRNYVPFLDRLKQYSSFLRYMFLPPSAGIHENTVISWQLYPSESVNNTWIFIIALALTGAFLNRKSKICRLSFMWLLYSFLILCALGWGTAENGLVLYTLYFSWAVFILIFSLVVKAEELYGVKFIVPAFVICSAIFMLWLNLPAMYELISFATNYYPYSW